jgi:transcriptional regulator with GAF, ATPase, and Fis domain
MTDNRRESDFDRALDTREPGSAAFFARVSRELMRQSEEEPTLQTVVEQAVAVIGPCDAASITVRRRRGRTETVASTAELASGSDELQYALQEGPCLETAKNNERYLSNDIGNDPRWPRWGPRAAAERGAHAIMSIELSTETEVMGSINLYSSSVEAYRRDDIDLAMIFAVHAANALSSARLITGLQTAVQSRHQIGIAQGILMHAYGLTMGQSFELLRRYSSHTNTKLSAVAAFVVHRGQLPDYPDQPLEPPSQPSEPSEPSGPTEPPGPTGG